MRIWWSVLALAACASSPVRRELILPRLAPGELARAFDACGTGSVVQRTTTRYQVFACYQVATYRCRAAACELQAIDPVGIPEPVLDELPVAAPLTAAQKRQADQLFDTAMSQYKPHEHDARVCELFEKSDAVLRTFGTALHLGDCAAVTDPVVALRLYRDAERMAKLPRQTDSVRDSIAQLAPQLCEIAFDFTGIDLDDPDTGAMTIEVEGRALAPEASLSTYVAPGDVEVRVALPGAAVRRWVLAAGPGELKTIHVAAGR